MTEKKFRYDIFLILILPLLISFASQLLIKKLCNIILFSMLLLVPIFEVYFLDEQQIKRGRQDQGIISGLLMSGIFLISLWFSNPAQSLLTLMIMIGFVSTGVCIRLISKIHLGKYFSHSVRIITEHELVDTGIYCRIRHPAYLGSIFIIIGATTVLNIEIQIIILVLTIYFVERRAKKEEKMLLNFFQKRYHDYSTRTYKYIPYVY